MDGYGYGIDAPDSDFSASSGSKPVKYVDFKFCIHCATNLPTKAKFCSECGKPARIKEAETQCGCGTALIPQGDFCYHCGEHKIAASKENNK